MQKSNLWAMCFLAAAGSGGGPPAAAAKRPEVGQAAPEFTVAATNGKTIKLGDFKGKRTVVLAFFPKAFTPG